MFTKADISGITETKQKQPEPEPESQAAAKGRGRFQDSHPAEPAERERCRGINLRRGEIFNLAAWLVFG